MTAATRLDTTELPSRGRALTNPRESGRTVLLLASNGRLGYRVLRCVAAVESVRRVVVLGTRGESSWPTRGLRASRFCDEFVPLDGQYADEAPLAQVNAVAARYPDALIAPADMAATRFLAVSAGRLDAPCVPSPSLFALDLLARKDAFAAFCQAAEIPHPPTALAADLAEARRLVTARPPDRLAVIKPLLGQGGVGVKFVSPVEAGWRVDYAPILVQDYVPGSDLCASAFCENGRIIAFQAYRHVTRSVLGKTLHTSLDFFDAPQLRALVAKAAGRTRLSGMVNFDARLSDAGELMLIECNPRPWFTMQLAMLAGRNFARLWFDETLRRRGLPPVSASVALFPGALLSGPGRRPGAHMRHMARDLPYFLSVDGWSRLLAGFRPHQACLD
jgi:glutathione synthase/RimK-type ligase-like ATP-grasp enzyme